MKTKKLKSMAMLCDLHKKSCSYSYRTLKCRCDKCKEHKRNKSPKEREAARKRSREWRLQNPERSKNNSKEYQKKNPFQVLKWQLKKYNITLDQYQQLEKASNGRCMICEQTPNGLSNSKKRLSIDHDHLTNKVRGLLCGSCNVGIGHFKHNVQLLQQAIKYLEKQCENVSLQTEATTKPTV